MSYEQCMACCVEMGGVVCFVVTRMPHVPVKSKKRQAGNS